MKDTFIFPDPFVAGVEPASKDENPHLQTSSRDPAPSPLATSPTPFTKGPFPRVVIPLVHLLGNIDLEQAKVAQETLNDYLAIVVFGAGKQFFTERPIINKEIETFLHSLSLDTTNISIAKAKPRGPASKDFDKPWPLFLTGASAELRTFLLWQQTFAISKDLAFHALPFDKNLHSWVLGNFQGGAVKDTEQAKLKALGTIKANLWKNGDF